MADDFINLRFYHQGKFQSTQYVGGKESVIWDIDTDLFSYTVVMEHVRDDLNYTEIGGIYARDGNKKGGWKLVANDRDLSELLEEVNSGGYLYHTDGYLDLYIDNTVDTKIEPLEQMQPHVKIRPRPNVFEATKQMKRQFMSTHQLQQLQRNKKPTEVYTPRKSARLNNAQVIIPNQVKSSQKQGSKVQRQGRGEAEVPSARKSPRLVSARQEIVEEKSARKSAPIKKTQCIDENLKSANVRRKLPLHNESEDTDEGEDADEGENMDENDFEDEFLPPPPPLMTRTPPPMKLTDYEMGKFQNMQRNNEKLIELGVPVLVANMSDAARKTKEKCKGKKKKRDEDEYVQEKEEESKDDASEILQKKNQKVKTRSRAKGVTTTEKGSTQNNNNDVANSVMVEPSKTQLPSGQGLGSIEDYFAMRERKQKKVVEKEVAAAGASGSGTKNDKVLETDLPDIEMEEAEAVIVPKRLRGKTRMDKVHTRPFEKRIVISMNDKFQPVSDFDKNVSELSRFLGTLKRCVPLTYASWEHVPETLKDTLWNYVKQRYILPEELKTWSWKTIQQCWKGYKSRVKRDHYNAYATDEDRLEHKPTDIPLEEFKLLLKYWGDPEVKAMAERNAKSRREYTDTHTAGPRLFSQIKHNMKKKQPDAEISFAKVFSKTRKRKPGKNYKTNPDVMQFRVDTIKKRLESSEGLDGLEELVSGGKKSHGPGWLIGRHDTKIVKKYAQASTLAPTDSYVQELTKKIRQEVVDEVEAKVNQKVNNEVDAKINKKVQDNLAFVLKKLVEANPSLNINIGEICATTSTDTDTDGDGSPTTEGPSS